MRKPHTLLKKPGAISGQSVIEYFVILTVILVAILSTGFIGNMRTAFKTYFNQAVANLK